ncbi:hypothetical protein PIB30_072927 [Stylosanthes scabra]|uniref:Uncharacterized protein n=1 Tax=Stylosanthes scabra TaxID=79078 RepID=A0ABU6WS95_9FABA|nr:hypothetical protein [Stylosanthes scabra]
MKKVKKKYIQVLPNNSHFSGGSNSIVGSGSSGANSGWTSILDSGSSGGNSGWTSILGQEEDSQPTILPEQEPHENLRKTELSNRLRLNFWGKTYGKDTLDSFITAQLPINRHIEAALVEDGYNLEVVFEKRHDIWSFLFYPQGRPLTKEAYAEYLAQIENLGGRPYGLIMLCRMSMSELGGLLLRGRSLFGGGGAHPLGTTFEGSALWDAEERSSSNESARLEIKSLSQELDLAEGERLSALGHMKEVEERAKVQSAELESCHSALEQEKKKVESLTQSLKGKQTALDEAEAAAVH